jgi:hypothetical protein
MENMDLRKYWVYVARTMERYIGCMLKLTLFRGVIEVSYCITYAQQT